MDLLGSVIGMSAIHGSPEQKRQQAESLVQSIVPGARCELWDYEHRLRCGLVDESGEKREFSLLLEHLDSEVLEAHAEGLKKER